MPHILVQGRLSTSYLLFSGDILYFNSASREWNFNGLSNTVSASGQAFDVSDLQIAFQKMSKHTNFRRHGMGGHDAEELKNFWEKVIQEQTKQQEAEESRLSKSALNK